MNSKKEILITPIFLHIPIVQDNISLIPHQKNFEKENESCFDHLISLGVKWVVLGHS